MGTSYGKNEPDPDTGLTPKDKALVTKTWALVKKDLKGNGVKLLHMYFTDFPEYLPFFPFKDLPLDEMPTNGKFKAHAANVIYALSAIVDSLDDNDTLISLLQKNGQSHAKRNIPPKAYDDLKTTAVKFLTQELGANMTPEVGEAWGKTVDVAFSVIKTSLVAKD